MFNLKGGQGKSSIALNLALTMDMNIISNDVITQIDDTKINKMNDLKKYIYSKSPNDMVTLHIKRANKDFFISKQANRITKYIIIIPMINGIMNNKTSLNSIEQVRNINKNILIIANKTKKDDYDTIYELVNKYFPEEKFPILELRETTAFEKIMEKEESIQKIVEKDKLLKFSYSRVVEQFNNIITFIRENINQY